LEERVPWAGAALLSERRSPRWHAAGRRRSPLLVAPARNPPLGLAMADRTSSLHTGTRLVPPARTRAGKGAGHVRTRRHPRRPHGWQRRLVRRARRPAWRPGRREWERGRLGDRRSSPGPRGAPRERRPLQDHGRPQGERTVGGGRLLGGHRPQPGGQRISGGEGCRQEQIQQVAKQLGISESQAADVVAKALPEVVDKVSPEGKLPPEQDLDAAFDKLAKAGAR
jgi:hypothetical protein